MKQKFLCFAFSLILLIGMLPMPALAEEDAYAALSGSGVRTDPHLIQSLSDLELFRDIVNGGADCAGRFFKLTSEIDMSAAYGAGKGEGGADKSWTPIGVGGHPFSGTFDGGGRAISGLYINAEQGLQGLFGRVGDSGTVRNVKVSGSITAGRSFQAWYVGGVAAVNTGTIENCSSSVAVSSENDYAGGIAGYSYAAGRVINCRNTGPVASAGKFVGGVVGRNASGTVEGCYNDGPVSAGVGYAGGVAGLNYDTGRVQNCCNTGTVTSAGGPVGGVVGGNEKSGTGHGSVENCYNVGAVSSTGAAGPVGGVAGHSTLSTVTNCFYLDTCGAAGEGTGKTAEEFKTLAGQLGGSYADSPFLERPVLNWPDVGWECPIPDLETLERFRDYVNSGGGQGETFVLTADIDMSPHYGAGIASWTPIGTDSFGDYKFTGVFDGGGHEITGLYIDSADFNQGLFGCTGDGGVIKNLRVRGDVTGDSNVGGIVGNNDFGATVENCSHTGTVTGTSSVGGVAGYSMGTVMNCFHTGSAAGTDSVGGVVGSNYHEVRSCYSTGDVTGTGSGVGGAVGSTRGMVENCYYLDAGGAGGEGARTAEEFASGQIAHLLQGEGSAFVWGQVLTGDSRDAAPVLTGESCKAVRLVTFTDGSETVAKTYVNFDGPVALPADPENEGYAFEGWYTQPGVGGTRFTDASAVREDATLYARWKLSAPEPPTPPEPDPGTPGGPEPCPRDETCPIWPYTDASTTAWYHDGVHYCLETGLMVGCGGGKFEPNSSLSRAQLLQILYNKEGRPGVSPDSGFADVAQGTWYAKAVSWAAQSGIAAGYGDGTFGPSDPITREQLAAILWRYAGSPKTTGKLDSFTDGDRASNYARKALEWAVETGMMEGKGGGVLDPRGNATRAEAATMMKKYCESGLA